jgi:long-subunit acyl-CoA synthetase (AMP-forming)
MQHLLQEAGLDEESITAKILIDKHVQKAIDHANKQISPEEQIKRYVILEGGFGSVDDDIMSGSLKLRRDVICKAYKELINGELYS